MKVRLHRNSLRLRLTPAEVAQLRGDGIVESATHFPGGALRCQLRVDPAARSITAVFDGSTISVSLQQRAALEWADGNAVGLDAEIPCSGGRTLHILVEKDFECMHDSDAAAQNEIFYPNPRT
jgi:hypothetical protein